MLRLLPAAADTSLSLKERFTPSQDTNDLPPPKRFAELFPRAERIKDQVIGFGTAAALLGLTSPEDRALLLQSYQTYLRQRIWKLTQYGLPVVFLFDEPMFPMALLAYRSEIETVLLDVRMHGAENGIHCCDQLPDEPPLELEWLSAPYNFLQDSPWLASSRRRIWGLLSPAPTQSMGPTVREVITSLPISTQSTGRAGVADAISPTCGLLLQKKERAHEVFEDLCALQSRCR